MSLEIHAIPLGFDTVYLLKDEGTIMIDSGVPKKEKQFLKALESVPIRPDEIKWKYHYTR
jgi:flavorubredoxin